MEVSFHLRHVKVGTRIILREYFGGEERLAEFRYNVNGEAASGSGALLDELQQ